MKQRVMHGGTIDAVTPEEVADIVAAAFEHHDTEQYRREKGVIALDGTGAGIGTVKTTRAYGLILERVTLSAGANAQFTFYENVVQASDLLEVATCNAQGVYSDAFSNRLFIPAGSQLFIVCAVGGANGQASFNLQVKLVRAVP